ncbi:hypothetical protein C8R43DRAFT_951760 [Mycena crocata]|nr:hypothetical protein C8R43DRAFT_951760 [Mycena crocata]
MPTPLPELGSFVTFDMDEGATLDVSVWGVPQHVATRESNLRGFVGFVDGMGPGVGEYECFRVYLLKIGDPGTHKALPVHPTPAIAEDRPPVSVPIPLPWQNCFLLSELSVAVLALENYSSEPTPFLVASAEMVRCRQVWRKDRLKAPREIGNRLVKWYRRLLHLPIHLLPPETEKGTLLLCKYYLTVLKTMSDLFQIWTDDGAFPVITNMSCRLPENLQPREPQDFISARDRLAK